MKRTDLPDAITSYDLLKFAAVLIMIADHVGYYIFPDQEWWRAIGRIGFPVWFFLVGHARGRNITPSLTFWAVILLAADALVGIGLIPLNALFTIILMRLFLDRLSRNAFNDMNNLLTSAVILLLLFLPGLLLTEYGTEAFIAGMFGYTVRNRPTFKDGSGSVFIRCFYAVFLWVTFVLSEQYLFRFTLWPGLFMVLGTACTICVLYRFEPKSYPALTRRLPRMLTHAIQFGGRRTMEIYGVHLIVLKIVGYFLFPQNYSLFHFSLLNSAVFGPGPSPAVAPSRG